MNKITLREHYAGMAMQGLLARYNLRTPDDQDTITKLSIELADTLIEKLKKDVNKKAE